MYILLFLISFNIYSVPNVKFYEAFKFKSIEGKVKGKKNKKISEKIKKQAEKIWNHERFKYPISVSYEIEEALDLIKIKVTVKYLNRSETDIFTHKHSEKDALKNNEGLFQAIAEKINQLALVALHSS